MAIRVQLNREGVRHLLRSPEVKAELLKRAQAIASTAGPGHKAEVFEGRNRARATVRTVTNDAALAEQHHKTLTNAIRAGK